MTRESEICSNRYISEKLEEDSLKAHLHLRITSIQNGKNLIADSLIRFAFHLSDYPDELPQISNNFLHEMIRGFSERELFDIEQKQELALADLEQLRVMAKIVAELVPNLNKPNKEELIRLKLYHYALLVQN